MKQSLFFAFSLVGQIGFATAIPLVLFGLGGRYLDNKFHTGPYLFLVGIIIATIMIYFILRKIVRDATENLKD